MTEPATQASDTAQTPPQEGPQGPGVDLKIDAPMAHIVLNRPDKRNALNRPMWQAIAGFIAQANADATVKLIILRGVDNAAFAAGADIDEFDDVYGDAATGAAYQTEIAETLSAVENSTKPVIAMIQGACLGGGCSLALACDLRFADNTARFAMTPALLGVGLDAGDARRLVRTLGPSRAKDLLFSARPIKAGEAEKMGLVNRVCDPGALMAEVKKYAEGVAGNSQISVRTAKALIDLAAKSDPSLESESERQNLEALNSADFAEGVSAFKAKRRARFKAS